eukprot:2167324-Rhodomonas_salina.1
MADKDDEDEDDDSGARSKGKRTVPVQRCGSARTVCTANAVDFGSRNGMRVRTQVRNQRRYTGGVA